MGQQIFELPTIFEERHIRSHTTSNENQSISNDSFNIHNGPFTRETPFRSTSVEDEHEPEPEGSGSMTHAGTGLDEGEEFSKLDEHLLAMNPILGKYFK